MPLKLLSYREIKRKLETAGFEVVSQKGSHVKFAKDTSEGKRLFGTWYGSIWGHKSTQSLSGKRFN